MSCNYIRLAAQPFYKFPDIEKVGDIVRPSSATALLSSLSTSSSGIGESLRSPSAEISMTSEASTSCASTPTTANTLPPLIEESSVEDETADGVGIATEKLVKSLIVVPSPSDTARVTSAISNDTVASGKTNEEDRKSIGKHCFLDRIVSMLTL